MGVREKLDRGVRHCHCDCHSRRGGLEVVHLPPAVMQLGAGGPKRPGECRAKWGTEARRVQGQGGTEAR